ncbi:MAG: alpha/beta fold hydrolase [Anaerolineae bacterium]|nr:alpha/beta fold hydrolase [Anaerolineae bacterium]
MTQDVRPDPAAFFLEGGDTGVLLVHGFPGSTTDVRLLGTYLHERGLTISAPLLPGHGAQPADLNQVRWQDWAACAEEALAQLSARCDAVFVGGLSLGSLITIYLGARHTEIAGIMLYSPAIAVRNPLIHLTPLLKHIVPFWPAGKSDAVDMAANKRLSTCPVTPTRGAHEVYKLTRVVPRLLPQVSTPALIVHSTRDRSIAPHSARLAYERIGSADKALVTLHNSGHNILVDAEWETVARKTYQFIEAHQ